MALNYGTRSVPGIAAEAPPVADIDFGVFFRKLLRWLSHRLRRRSKKSRKSESPKIFSAPQVGLRSNFESVPSAVCSTPIEAPKLLQFSYPVGSVRTVSVCFIIKKASIRLRCSACFRLHNLNPSVIPFSLCVSFFT